MIVGLLCASRQLVTADFEGYGFNTEASSVTYFLFHKIIDI